jgi:hypothetical protein
MSRKKVVFGQLVGQSGRNGPRRQSHKLSYPPFIYNNDRRVHRDSISSVSVGAGGRGGGCKLNVLKRQFIFT